MNRYENMTPDERLSRIANILVPMIYRAVAERQAKEDGKPIITAPKPYYGLKEKLRYWESQSLWIS